VLVVAGSGPAHVGSLALVEAENYGAANKKLIALPITALRWSADVIPSNPKPK
jgi:hypothetical protein